MPKYSFPLPYHSYLPVQLQNTRLSFGVNKFVMMLGGLAASWFASSHSSHTLPFTIPSFFLIDSCPSKQFLVPPLLHPFLFFCWTNSIHSYLKKQKEQTKYFISVFTHTFEIHSFINFAITFMFGKTQVML